MKSAEGKSLWKRGKTDDKILGKGTFGTVVLGHNKKTGETVAIKLIETKDDDRKQKHKQIKDEVIILQQMRHKNILRYYGLYEHKSKTHIGIVCEFISNGSLQRLLQKFGAFIEPLIRKYTSDILKGLQYLHYHGIIHRDIKGANILVDSDGVCKLADFGLAKSIVSQDSNEGQIVLPQGTPNWMAPEVCRQGSCNSRFSDIWSLGCTIIEMMTGKPPYPTLLAETIILKVGLLKAPPQYLDTLNCSEKLKDFLLRCFQIKPEERWNVDQLLSHPFILDADSIREKHVSSVRKRNTSVKNKPKKNTLISQENQSTENQNLDSQNKEKSSPLPETPSPQPFSTQFKNPLNKPNSLKTILEESNQQYTIQEDCMETQLRLSKSRSFYHEELTFGENMFKDLSFQSFDPSKVSAVFAGEQFGQSLIKQSTYRDEGSANNLDYKLRSQKYRSVLSNTVLKDDIDEEQEINEQNGQNHSPTRISQNTNGMNINLNQNKIDEVEDEDDDENVNSPNYKKKLKQNNKNKPKTPNQNNNNTAKESFQQKIASKITEDYDEEVNEMQNPLSFRGIPSERKIDERIEVKQNNTFNLNIIGLSKQKNNINQSHQNSKNQSTIK